MKLNGVPPISAFHLAPDVNLPFVYVATFPRSGTTWVLRSLLHIFGGQEAEIDSKQNGEHKITLMSASYVGFKEPIDPARPVIIKSHLPRRQFVSRCTHSRTVYVMRDGRDALTSLYFFKQPRAWKRGDDEIRFDAAEFSRHLTEEAPQWRDHILGWLDSPNAFFTAYEYLKLRYAEEMQAIVDYAGLPIMQSVASAREIFVDQFQPNNKFFRKGIIGDWANYWNGEHKAIFKRLANDALVRLGYVKDDNW